MKLLQFCLVRSFYFGLLRVEVKSNRHYSRIITPKRLNEERAYPGSLAPGQNNSEETSQRWRAVGDTVSDFTDPGFKSQTSRTGSNFIYFFIFFGKTLKYNKEKTTLTRKSK